MPSTILFEVRPGYVADDVLGEVPQPFLEAATLRPAFRPQDVVAILNLRGAAQAAQAARVQAIHANGHATTPVSFHVGGRTLVLRRKSAAPFGGTRVATGMFDGSFDPTKVWRVGVSAKDAQAVRAALRNQAGVAEVSGPGRLKPASLCKLGNQDYLENKDHVGMNLRAAQVRLAALGFGNGSQVVVGVADVGFPPGPDFFERAEVASGAKLPFEGENGDLGEQTHGLSTLCGLFGTHPHVTGIVPHASPRLAVINTTGTFAELAGTIARLALDVGPGGVVLVEFQLERGTKNIPIYLSSIVRSVIRAAAFYGVLVVVPSGNSDVNLDAVEAAAEAAEVSDEPMDVPMLLVGGVIPSRPRGVGCERRRVARCGRGKRVDCYGWYGNVAVLQPFGTGINTWGGTSAASAMLAGAAVLVQSFCVQKYGAYLDAFELRELLRNRDPLYGAPARALSPLTGDVEEMTDVVGVMPDLDALIAALDGGTLPLPTSRAPSGPEELARFLQARVPDPPIPSIGVATPSGTAPPTSPVCGFRAPRLRKPRLRWPCRC